ncbi:MAG: argininosuccinate lyase [Clostridia bacterium]|nr:argininosuccinate lyase [Clostridia bacterium]
MAKMWAGRTSGETNKMADSFNSSISFDSRMYKQDITGSIAHAKMRAKCEIITEEEMALLVEGLNGILSDIESGALTFDPNAEDIHMFVEEVLTARIGTTGKKLHTARSRNDQVALDIRMYLRDEIDKISAIIEDLIKILSEKEEEYKDTIMPGYTHLQRAQPITFGIQLGAYKQMFMRDASRLIDCKKRLNMSPIGCCALAGTTYNTDRAFEAGLLGFDGVIENTIDGVSDRDFALELSSVISIIMMHLSRLSEETVLWTSSEFGFVTLDDAFTTGSSIMPQKKNSDMAELVRGKTGRVYGDMVALFTTMKALPLAYNKDMQEDKEQIFDAVDSVKACLDIFCGMLSTMKVNADAMKAAAAGGFINATDLADYLVVKGLPFRDAYKISGSIVARCIKDHCTLETLPLDVYKEYSELFAEDLFTAIDLLNCVKRRQK